MEKIQFKRATRFRRWRRAGYGAFITLHRPVSIGVLSIAMTASFLSVTNTAYAQRSDSLQFYKELDIEAVEVEATKASPTRSAMSSVSVYNRNVGAAAPVQTLESALRLSPSIDLRERGGRGTQADIMIRGGSFDQTMVMLNGINFTDVRTGHQSHSLPIDMDYVAGIDLIDGVSGVGAYAGAVNIRTQPLKPRYLRLEGVGGGDGYVYGNLSGGYSTGKFSLFGATSYRRSDGYIHNTGFDNYNAYLRMNYDSPRVGYFDFQAGYQNRAWGSNGFYSLAYPDQFEQTSTALGSLRWMKSIDRVTLNATASYRKNFDRFELIKGEPEKVPYNYHNTDNVGAEFWADLRWKGGTTSLGGDYTYNHIWSTVLGELVADSNGRYDHAKSRHVGNVWLRHVKRWRTFDAAGSAGVSFTPYGTSALWSLTGGYLPLDGLRLEVGAAQSMRLPTFTDLYYTTVNHISNPDLKPEHAITYRFAASYARERWDVSAVTYYRDGWNTIDWVRDPQEEVWRSLQITDLGTFGVEFTGHYRTPGFLRQVTLSYGYVDISKESGRLISRYALDYMRHKAVVSVEVAFLRNFTMVLTGAVYDRNGNYVDRDGQTRSYTPYFLLDGRLAWQKGIWKLFVDAMNITDTRYFDFGGLQMPGAWFSGGVAITIG